jgi:hypothetical protein
MQSLTAMMSAVDVDEWVRKYNEERPHWGRYCGEGFEQRR